MAIVLAYHIFLRTIHGITTAGTAYNGRLKTLIANSDSTALATLILTIITAAIYPLLQRPLLDYTVTQISDRGNVTSFEIHIMNLGLASC